MVSRLILLILHNQHPLRLSPAGAKSASQQVRLCGPPPPWRLIIGARSAVFPQAPARAFCGGRVRGLARGSETERVDSGTRGVPDGPPLPSVRIETPNPEDFTWLEESQ
ncbi:Hypothetical protein NTJ_04221 [Nesidiocoris tenuis]|uniref:Uncharacterized protein n=1 Tax=Nesidiocoris tenuis TaxID=355587 RepID=A0ABN7AH93_9HEMI|nr:Hypothetical protein NTJ_04221 [Nesidiocoris tenuis]